MREGIAADRAAQKAAREAEAAKAAGLAPPVAPAAPKPVVCNQQKNYDECRIQIRLTDGKTMVEKFKASEQLAVVSFLCFLAINMS